MKEKIIEILNNHVFDETFDLEGDRPILHHQPCILEEDFNDTANDIEHLINQEVERRIAERMPSDEEIGRAFTSEHYHWEKGRYYKVRKDRIFGAKWLRSRLTNDSQKTEGGGE